MNDFSASRAAGPRSNPAGEQRRTAAETLLHSPATVTALLILTVAVAIGLVATGTGGRSAATSTPAAPAEQRPSPVASAPATAPTTEPGAAIDLRESPVLRAQDAGREPDGYTRTDPSRRSTPETPPLAGVTTQPVGPIHLGSIVAIVVIAAAVCLLVIAVRMMFRLFVVLGAVVQVVARISTSLTLLMGGLVLTIVGVLAAR